MKSQAKLAAALVACCALAACDSTGRTRGPSTRVAAIHAAPSFGEISFLREERFVTGAESLSYRSSAVATFEVGQYDFNVDVLRPGAAGPERSLTFSETLQPDTDYFFVITENAGALAPIVAAAPSFDPASGSAQTALVHAAPGFGAVDVYLTAPAANLSAANAIGTAAFMEALAPQTIAAGDYQLSLTEPGNPLNVLFSSPTLALAAGQDEMFVITDGGGEGVVPIHVVRLGGDLATLTDVNAVSAVRAINAASDGQPRDLVVDDDFAAPLFPALPYAEPSADAPTAPGARVLKATPAGNPGVVEGESGAALAPGRAHTVLVTGAAGDLDITTVMEDRRRIAGQASLRIFNGAGQFESLDFFILQPGVEIDTVAPLSLAAGTFSAAGALPPGDFEITIRLAQTQTAAFGPLTVTVEGGGLYSVLAVNGATPDTADVVLFDDFQ